MSEGIVPAGSDGPNYKLIGIVAATVLPIAAILTVVVVVTHRSAQVPTLSPTATVSMLKSKSAALLPKKDQGDGILVSCPTRIPARRGTVFECIVDANGPTSLDEYTFTMKESDNQGTSVLLGIKPYKG